jgi:hypothetical protein
VIGAGASHIAEFTGVVAWVFGAVLAEMSTTAGVCTDALIVVGVSCNGVGFGLLVPIKG